MRHGVVRTATGLATLLLVVLAAAGCSHEPGPTASPTAERTVADPAYDASLPPATAVLSLVPDTVAAVTVTDFDQVRADLGLPDVGDASPAADQASFWQQAEQQRPLLTRGMLRDHDAALAAAYGFTSLDVAWEAHLLDASGAETGWVLAFRSGVDLGAVQRAVQAGAAPLAGAAVDGAAGLVTLGTAADSTQSWAADPDFADLTSAATQAAASTYLAKGCSTASAATTASAASASAGGELSALSAYAIQYGDQLATAWLGADRTDLFTRLRLTEADPDFAADLTDGVADPRTGRIGFIMTDPVAAVRFALRGRLPFASCS